MLTTRFCLTSLLIAVLSATGGAALAAGAGQVQHLSGTLTVQRADGSVRILSQKSEVNPGEVLTTQKDSYAQINFTDGSSMTMRPSTQMKLESYQFVQDKPQEDSAFFRLLKGGLRTVTGLVGKRGNQDAYRIGVATATIDIRGSGGETFSCNKEEKKGCDDVVGGGDKVPDGDYHTTYTGSYIMQNDAGSIIIGEGEFGYSKDKNIAPEKRDNPGFDLLKELPFVIIGMSKDCVVR